MKKIFLLFIFSIGCWLLSPVAVHAQGPLSPVPYINNPLKNNTEILLEAIRKIDSMNGGGGGGGGCCTATNDLLTSILAQLVANNDSVNLDSIILVLVRIERNDSTYFSGRNSINQLLEEIAAAVYFDNIAGPEPLSQLVDSTNILLKQLIAGSGGGGCCDTTAHQLSAIDSSIDTTNQKLDTLNQSIGITNRKLDTLITVNDTIKTATDTIKQRLGIVNTQLTHVISNGDSSVSLLSAIDSNTRALRTPDSCCIRNGIKQDSILAVERQIKAILQQRGNVVNIDSFAVPDSTTAIALTTQSKISFQINYGGTVNDYTVTVEGSNDGVNWDRANPIITLTFADGNHTIVLANAQVLYLHVRVAAVNGGLIHTCLNAIP